MSISPRLSRCLVEKNGHELELYFDDKPSRLVGDFAEFIQALNSIPRSITSVHLHNSFLKELSESQKVELSDCLSNLEEMTIASATISASLLTRILRQAPRLQKLSLERVVFVGDAQDNLTVQKDFYLALQGLREMRELHFCFAPIAANVPEGMRLFFQDGDRLDHLLKSLSQFALKSFYLSMGRNSSDNYVAPQTLKDFMASSVEDVTLINCHLNEEQCLAIAQSSLVSLSLINAGLGPGGAKVLARAISQMTKLQKLYLPDNKIMNEGAIAIAQAASNLKVLDLHDNNLSASFAKVMAANLGGLEFLDVSCNPLGDAGAKALAASLSHNSSLEQMNMYDTNLSDKSCVAFARTLDKNQTMRRLNVYNNKRITNAGVEAFLQSLEYSNYTLERLEISKDRSLEAALDVYLKLNRSYGRRNLMAPSTTDNQYFESIQQATSENDLSSIFYLLQQRPSLHTSLTSTETTSTKTAGALIAQEKLFTAAPRTSLKDIPCQGKIFANPQA